MATSPVTLTIVVPAFNEETNLEPVLRGTSAALEAARWLESYDIVVVDDGSRDATGRVADALARELRHVHVVHHPTNRGFGAALQSGYARATGAYVAAIPADGEVDVEQALTLLRDMGDADVMVSRRERTPSVRRDLFTAGWHGLMRVLVGGDLRGMDGIYVIRTSLLRQLTVRSTTGLINLEILMQCARRGVRMDGGLMQTRPRLSGESKVMNVRTMSKIAWEMVKLRVALLRTSS
jgi:glycosyltransferase involved in cell wall biosynthesis